MPTNIIHATSSFSGRSAPILSTREHNTTAERHVSNAVDRCSSLKVLPDAIVAALAVEILKIADENNWTAEKRAELIPPAVRRLTEGNFDVPY